VDAGYARVSSVIQDTTIQLLDLERAGIHPSNIFEEKVSGVAKSRPVRDQVLAQLKPGDTLTVWKLDRLGRSMTEVVGIIEDLIDRGVQFRCITQNINISAPVSGMSKMQLQLLAMFAEFERAQLLERTAAGKARRQSEGKHPGGPALFGWRPGNEEQDPDEAQALATIAEMILDQGMNLSRVVEQLNTSTPRGGGHWRVTSLRRILTNPRTEVVIPDRFQDLQKILRRNVGQGQGGGRPAEHLLSGILTCGREGCGQPLYSARQVNRNRSPQRVYRCKPGTGSGGRFGGCGSTQVSEARADAYAEEMFIGAIVSPKFAQALDRRQAELAGDVATVQELDDWREEIQELELVQPTRWYDEEKRNRHAQLRRMVDQATTRLMAQPDLQALVDLPRSEQQLRARWSSWSISTRRSWLRRLVEKIDVMPATIKGRGSDVESRLEPIWKL
jgi:DNA invertase Pin-like site-specific DNA recombinase